MKCINTHRNWAQLQLMLQSFFFFFPPYVSLKTLCWWCGTTPTTSITKLESAKSAVTSAVILSQMQKKCVTLVSHLFYQLSALFFHTASMLTHICIVPFHFSLVRLILCQELARQRRQKQEICSATDRQWSTSIFYSISVTNFIFNSPSVNANYTVK